MRYPAAAGTACCRPAAAAARAERAGRKIKFISCNAAIEAAQTGNMGTGFAGIATEIRPLPGKIQTLLKDISGDLRHSPPHLPTAGHRPPGARPDQIFRLQPPRRAGPSPRPDGRGTLWTRADRPSCRRHPRSNPPAPPVRNRHPAQPRPRSSGTHPVRTRR